MKFSIYLEPERFDFCIYHEHVNYWCLISIMHFIQDSEMKVYKVKEVNTHGGSLRVYATKNKEKRIHKSVSEYLEIEKKNRLDKYQTYLKFSEKVQDTKEQSLEMINQIKLEKKKIIGFGAPAKAPTVLNYFGLNEKDFLFTIMKTHKKNKYIPRQEYK